MKTTYTKERILIVQGELYIFKGNDTIASTAPDAAKMGFIQLDRKAFVKPVDVYQLAIEWAGNKDLFSQLARGGFIAGYHANPNEFTREDMEQCWLQATRKASDFNNESGFTKFLDSLEPLSIPESVTIENNQVIDVKWK